MIMSIVSALIPVALMLLERYLLGVKADEETWRLYVAFISKTKFWSQLPAEKQAAYRARIERLSGRADLVFNQGGTK